ncbi:MAG: hypothetical protein Q9219_006675 [cf. Caloplaca sp. 3 TL-2023]
MPLKGILPLLADDPRHGFNVVKVFQITEVTKLIERVQRVGQRLIAAQPKELAVGNIVRRVLGVIRDEVEENREGEVNTHSQPESFQQSPETWLGLNSSTRTGRGQEESHKAGIYTPIAPSNLFSYPSSRTAFPFSAPENQLPHRQALRAISAPLRMKDAQDLRAEVIEGIQEIIDELNQVDDQIAAYAPDHVHSNEVILTYTPSMTVQKFLYKAASKRKFTVILAETFSGKHRNVVISHDNKKANFERFQKSLATAGVTIILVPHSAVFALMPRVNKVILDADVVLANGDLTATAGATIIAKAARMHRRPVVVLSGVYKLSPVHPFDVDAMIEYRDPDGIVRFGEGKLAENIHVHNPILDYIPADLVDLYVTNLGGHSPSYVYRIVADHYRSEDMHLMESDD